MNLVNLILVCSVAGSPANHDLLYQIAQTANQSQTYIDDLTARKVYDPPRLKEAAGITRALLESGHDVRVGLTQLPAREVLRDFEVTPRALVDGCRNIALGSARLERARARYSDNRLQALSFYFTGKPRDPVGLGWARDVLQARRVDVEHAATHPEAAPPSPGFSGPDGRIFPAQEDEDPEGGRPKPPTSRKLFVESNDDSRAKKNAQSDTKSSGETDAISKFPAPDENTNSADTNAAEQSSTEQNPSFTPSSRRSETTSSGVSSAYRSADGSSSQPDSAKRPLPDVTDEKLPVPDSPQRGDENDQTGDQ